MKKQILIILVIFFFYQYSCSQNIKYKISNNKIEQGDSILLTWECKKTKKLTLISKEKKSLSLNGSIYLKPRKTTTYILKAQKKKKTKYQKFSIKVYKAEILKFQANSYNVNYGDTIVLNWRSLNAKEIKILEITEDLSEKNSFKYGINSTEKVQTFTLVANGDITTDTAQIEIKVYAKKEFECHAFTFSDVWTRIWWRIEGAKKVTIEGQEVPSFGFSQFYLDKTKKFELIAYYKNYIDTIYCSIAVHKLSEARNVDTKEMLKLINQARSQGRYCGAVYCPATAPVKWSPTLEKAAQIQSEYMFLTSNYSHTGQCNSHPRYRVARTNYSWNLILGENIARGQTSEKQVINSWLQSPGHCRNIMGMSYKYVAVGRKGNYWTQLFSRKLKKSKNKPIINYFEDLEECILKIK